VKNVYNCIGHELKLPDIVDSKGSHLFDSKGRGYLDLESGVWCISLGHGDPSVNAVITSQIESLIQAGFCYTHPIVEEAAAGILDVTGLDGGQCVFLCSGSEAIEISRQIARHLTGNRMSMTLHDSYLGAYSSVSDRSSGWFMFDWTQCATCPHNGECRKDCEHLRCIPTGISDFVFEPGSSSGFVRFPPEALIHNLVGIVRAGGGKVVVNEVTTGTGRTGKWFGFQHYAIQPDLVAVGKGIGNGYPVSVAVISAETVEELRSNPFKYSQSHQNDPLGASVVKQVVESIRERGLIQRADELGQRFLEKLTRLVDGEILIAARGRGLMMALDVRDEATTDRIHDALIDQGFIVGNRGRLIRIDPPLTIDESDFDLFVECLGRIVADCRY